MTELDLDAARSTDRDPPPSLTVSGPDGRRVTIDLAAYTHTVGELADVLGIPRRAVVLVDGRAVDRRVRLDRSGVVNGSKVTCRSSRAACRAERAVDARDEGSADGHLVVTVDAGPAAGAVVVLSPGRHLIGRSATCAVRLDDALAELHHAVLDVRPASQSTESSLVQLAGRVPCWSGGAEPESESPLGGRVAAEEHDSVVTIGASRIRFAATAADGPSPVRPAALAPRRDDPWRLTLHRPPRQPVDWVPSPIEPPATDPAHPLRSAGGLLAGLVSVVGGVALAIVLGHPMYLIFSCVGFAAAAGSALSRRVGDRKRRRRYAAESKRDRERFAREVAAQHDGRVAHQRATAPTIAVALRVVRDLSAELWARRADHADGFTVSLGWGATAWEVRVNGSAGELSEDGAAIVDRHGLLEDVPVTTDLGPGQAVAIVGEHGQAVARSIVVQLAALTGPADWQLVVVADDPDEWEWCGWLPHASSGAGCDLGPMIAAADDGARLAAHPFPPRSQRRSPRRRGDRPARRAVDADRCASPPSGVGAVGGGGRRRAIRGRRSAAVPRRAAHRQSVRRSMVPRRHVWNWFAPGPRRRRVRRRGRRCRSPDRPDPRP